MAPRIELSFNSGPSTIMHIDLNSCFASIEQQANPLLRGKPLAVAAYTTPSGCILAPSIEAKKLGVRVGMRVKDGRLLCPQLIVLPPDPDKYRHVHTLFRKILSSYTTDLTPKSIDEFVLNLEGFPGFNEGMFELGREIKNRIKKEIGEWITVSIGIGPNRFLAKTASNLKKPDGLEEINFKNYTEVYKNLKLTDLHGINQGLSGRLNSAGIFSVMDFYGASLLKIRSAFHSVCSYYWYLRLRGWEIDDVNFGRKSFGNMYSLPKTVSDFQLLAPILQKLVEKTCFRMRSGGYKTQGVHVALLYKDSSFWHKGTTLNYPIFDSRDVYAVAKKIVIMSPYQKPVANISVSCFHLTKNNTLQLDLFSSAIKKSSLTAAMDSINEKYGNFVITPAVMLAAKDIVPDRIGFGAVKELFSY